MTSKKEYKKQYKKAVKTAFKKKISLKDLSPLGDVDHPMWVLYYLLCGESSPHSNGFLAGCSAYTERLELKRRFNF